MRVAIETHGCKLNQADSEALARCFQELGHQVVSADAEGVEVYILNTCTVTHTADAKARQALRSAHRRHPQALLVATGCLAQRAPEALRAIPGVSLVVGNTHKESLPTQVLALLGQENSSPCATGVPTEAPFLLGRTRAFVKIQEGCNQVCAYCIVPKVRGRERSIPLDDLVRTVQEREAQGYKEVVLTGTQLGSYGYEWGKNGLVALLEALLHRTSIPRIRVSSLQPQELTPTLLALWSDPRLCPHFHIPLQSGSDSVLQRMRRRYTRRDYLDAVERIRTRLPMASITTDIIVGFPGETEEDFQQTVSLCREVGFARMHLFPYSRRPGTSAFYFSDAVPPEVKRWRMGILGELARQQALAYRQNSVGSTRPVLWEEGKPFPTGQTLWYGLTDTYVRVCTLAPVALGNHITPARLVSVQGEVVWAKVEQVTASEAGPSR
ncbi:MAG: tRNA (N(6)-L-threonylcarbamoyladenosine(37)-C(2))-methylthiotransferase MtaB [Chloroflexota bacterium]|nr:tRNA (N(6)-L-threonylcarbamoyladenosine(37)-C(2))-methylthiotransferase MtaB [Chloroflexota bacterium]